MATDATPLQRRNIKDLKTQVRKINLSVPCYEVTADANGVINITDTILPSTPTNGLRLILYPSADVSSPKLSLNGGTAYPIYVQTTANWGEEPRTPMLGIKSYNTVELVFRNGIWRCLNIHSNIVYSDLSEDLRHQLEVTRILRNVKVSNDTPTGWYNQFGSGVHFVYYDTASCFASQPSQYGFLEILAINPAEVSLIWRQQSGAFSMVRAGNSTNGWGGDWRYVVDTFQQGTVSNAMIADNAVTRAKIGDGAVGVDEIANGAVIHDKLSDTSVWDNNLGSGAVTATKIANGAILLDHFSRGTNATNNVVASDRNVLRFRDMRIMWGGDTVTVPASGQATHTVTYPEAFVRDSINVQLTSSTNVDCVLNIESKLKTGFTYRVRSSHGAQYSQAINWLAIG